jgi:nucleoid DNA-binding protein
LHRYSSGLSKDTISSCLRLTIKHITELLETGQHIQLDVGLGTLYIKGKLAEFAPKASVNAALAAAAAATVGSATQLTSEVLSQLSLADGRSGMRKALACYARHRSSSSGCFMRGVHSLQAYMTCVYGYSWLLVHMLRATL